MKLIQNKHIKNLLRVGLGIVGIYVIGTGLSIYLVASPPFTYVGVIVSLAGVGIVGAVIHYAVKSYNLAKKQKFA